MEVISLKFAQKVFQNTEYRIIPGQKICKSCRDFLTQFIDLTENNKIELTEIEDQSNDIDQSNDNEELSLCDFKYNLDSVNNALKELGLKSLSVTQAQSSSLVEKKISEVTKTIRDKLKVCIEDISSEQTVMDQFKDNFHSFNKQDQYCILTSIPKQYGQPFLQEFFGITDHQAKIAKSLQEEKGILSILDPKPGKTLPEETINKGKVFMKMISIVLR